MTSNSLPHSNQANGGKLWNPYLGKSPQTAANPKPVFSTASLVMISVGVLLGFLVSLIPTFDYLHRISNPAAHHVSNGIYYLVDIDVFSGFLLFMLSGILFAGLSFIVGVTIARFYKKSNKDSLKAAFNFYGTLVLLFFIIALMTVFSMSFTNSQPGASYDNWLKKQINVSEIVYLKNDFIQGKDGIYKVDGKKENGYFKYSVKKVEL